LNDQTTTGDHQPDVPEISHVLQAVLDKAGHLLDLGLGSGPETGGGQISPDAGSGMDADPGLHGKSPQKNRGIQGTLDGILRLDQLVVVHPADGVNGHKKS
jgi:hypothetical protein